MRDSLLWRSWCYFEAQVWKKDSNIVPSLFFSHFLFGPFLFFMASFFGLVQSLIPTCGGIIVSIILSLLGQCSNDGDHHTFIFLQLNNYNSILRTKYDSVSASGGVPGCAMNKEWHVCKNYEWWLCHKYDVNYMIMLRNMTMMECVIINGTVESCMAIYIGMAMEIPW